eukprot:9643201-Karenia_brevis.AAC.1
MVICVGGASGAGQSSGPCSGSRMPREGATRSKLCSKGWRLRQELDAAAAHTSSTWPFQSLFGEYP